MGIAGRPPVPLMAAGARCPLSISLDWITIQGIAVFVQPSDNRFWDEMEKSRQRCEGLGNYPRHLSNLLGTKRESMGIRENPRPQYASQLLCWFED
jgi:hypothetical protein